jgi:stage III sporulation protein SpoIIIAA
MATLKLNPERPTDADLLRDTMRQCAADLEDVLALKVGVMDSESKAAAVAKLRVDAMHSVVARLREA